MRMEYYLVSTDHLERNILFRDTEDYKAGMNDVALALINLKVRILAFILMSNHVHFVLEGDMLQSTEYISRFKQYYSQYYHNRYGVNNFLKKHKVDVTPLNYGDESLERGIAYVLMNSVAANICLSINNYPWGSGDSYFNKMPRKGTPVNSLSCRFRYAYLHSRLKLPAHFLWDESGYIQPQSYISVGFVEKLFRTPKRMNFFLNNSSKAKRVLTSETPMPTFKDETIISSIRSLCSSLYRKDSFTELSESQKIDLIKQLKFRFSAGVNQLSRVTGLTYEEVVEYLDKV